MQSVDEILADIYTEGVNGDIYLLAARETVNATRASMNEEDVSAETLPLQDKAVSIENRHHGEFEKAD